MKEEQRLLAIMVLAGLERHADVLEALRTGVGAIRSWEKCLDAADALVGQAEDWRWRRTVERVERTGWACYQVETIPARPA